MELVVDRYELVHELAAGGMATVYLGRVRGAVGFARIVAVKRLHQHFARDKEFVSMFLDEARLASRIRHPNVVPTIDVVAQAGELFLVMEYVHGESLAAIWRAAKDRGVSIPVPVAAAIVSGMLLGLHAAHEATDEAGQPLHVVHRDVSPQNVLVGADGIVRVVDFGVSKATGRLQSTTEGQVKGKAGYLAPEQLSGEVDRRCDIYATSVVFWELLTGQRLFTGDLPARVLASILAGDVPSPSSIAPDLPDALEEIVMVGLDRAPEQRFATAREMDRALHRAVPIASTFEVAEWLSWLMGDSLRARAAAVAGVERAWQPDDSRKLLDVGAARARDDEATVAPTIAERNRAGGRRISAPMFVGLGVIGVALAIIGLGARALLRSSEPSPSSAESAQATLPAPAAPLASSPPAVAVTPTEPPAPSAPPRPLASSRPVPSAHARGASRSRPDRPSCSPPYTVDSEGHRHFIVECLP